MTNWIGRSGRDPEAPQSLHGSCQRSHPHRLRLLWIGKDSGDGRQRSGPNEQLSDCGKCGIIVADSLDEDTSLQPIEHF
jgi:hypothetical protein